MSAALGLRATFPTASGGITRLALERLRRHSVDGAPLLRRAGLRAAQVDDPGARVSVAGQIKFLEAAADALDDPWLGFHLAQHFELRGIGLLYFVLASSETLIDALRRAERYGRMVNEAVSLRCAEGPDVRIRLSHVGVPRHSDRQQVEFFVTALIRVCRRLTGRDLAPSYVRLAHHRSGDASELTRLFRTPVEFNAGVDEIGFARDVKEHALPNADPYLSELLIGYCKEALAGRDFTTSTLRADVENALAPLLPHGPPDAQQVAARLGMSYRTLARRLRLENQSFADILAELRAELAARYLADPALTISQIAWLLGYAEASSFTHAMKKRTGRTPRELRSDLKPLPCRAPGERHAAALPRR